MRLRIIISPASQDTLRVPLRMRRAATSTMRVSPNVLYSCRWRNCATFNDVFADARARDCTSSCPRRAAGCTPWRPRPRNYGKLGAWMSINGKWAWLSLRLVARNGSFIQGYEASPQNGPRVFCALFVFSCLLIITLILIRENSQERIYNWTLSRDV